MSLSVPFSSGHRLLPSRGKRRQRLSVPFSSGHRLLLRGPAPTTHADFSIFQSPFHRGIGCYNEDACQSPAAAASAFQSPFHRGIGCYVAIRGHIGARLSRLSVPFSSGHRLLQLKPYLYDPIDVKYFQSPFHRGIGCYLTEVAPTHKLRRRSFSPLFIGA